MDRHVLSPGKLLAGRKSRAARILEAIKVARKEIRQGRFRRSMAVIAAFSAVVSGFEAYVQHQRGAFEDRLMWTPVWLMPPVVGAAGAALFSEKVARKVLPAVSLASLADGVLGFGLHLRGVSRMPGGFKVGQYNIVMGPPVFAPLLVGIVGVLGLFASALRPEALDALTADLQPGGSAAGGSHDGAKPAPPAGSQDLRSEIAHGRFQQGMALTAASLAVFSGGEAYFEHLRGSYNRRLMWTPVWVTPPMIAAAVGAARSRWVAHRVLPVVSLVTLGDGLLGFWLHLGGLRRMPGSYHNLRFNVTLGPPLFAPLLFSAVGLLGLIASLLRREKQ